jgi:SagB-type dehydrogenase family enzyme
MHKNSRDFLKDQVRKTVDFSRTGQSRGIEPPPPQKPCPPGAQKIALTAPGAWRTISRVGLEDAISRRKSRRTYMKEALGLEELSFLLWATQGLRPTRSAFNNFRTVPSAGCRHAMETYIAAFRVAGLAKAIYRYLPLDHALVEVVRRPGLEERLAQATLGQRFCGASAATFIWTAVPARMEWRYAEASYKVIALDAGHICQNLYLACESIGAGACAVAAYDQERMDEILGVDGEEEFTLYLAPVGKVSARPSEDE